MEIKEKIKPEEAGGGQTADAFGSAAEQIERLAGQPVTLESSYLCSNHTDENPDIPYRLR